MAGRIVGSVRVSSLIGAAVVIAVAAGALSACSNTPPAASPDESPGEPMEQSTAADTPAEESAESAEPESEAPAFKSGMTVEEAIAAVPSTAQRIHIEEEALAEPLKNPEVYEPCKLKGHQHFTIRVAVWQGKAVGLDITTKPESAELESCLRTQIEALEWEDKVESLNTVEFSF
jgi:hypothetical protein